MRRDGKKPSAKPRDPRAVDKHIGARIRMRRGELGIGQAALGDKLGVSFQQVQKYEKGANRVGGSRMAAIAEVLQVDVGFFYLDSPGVTGPCDSVMDNFMASRDGLMIAQAFVRIANPEVRAAIAGFVRQMGRTGGADLAQAAE